MDLRQVIIKTINLDKGNDLSLLVNIKLEENCLTQNNCLLSMQYLLDSMRHQYGRRIN